MIKLAITHKVLDACINMFFSNVEKNFDIPPIEYKSPLYYQSYIRSFLKRRNQYSKMNINLIHRRYNQYMSVLNIYKKNSTDTFIAADMEFFKNKLDEELNPNKKKRP